MNCKTLPIIGVFFLLMTSMVQGQDSPGKDRWTPEDIIFTEYASSVTFSPDNKMVAWTKRKGVKEKDRFVNDLYLTRLDLLKDGMPRTFQLTNGDDSDYSPLFSADGEKIYFLSSREKGKKLWSLSIFGGEPVAVKEFKNGISGISWLNDSTMLFTSNDGKSLYDMQMEKKKDNTVVVEDSVHWTIQRVYAFDLKKKETRRLTDDRYPVRNYAASRDGKWLVYSLTMSRHYATDANPVPTHFLLNLETGEKTQILKGLQTPRSFEFLADNSGFYFTADQSSDPEWNGSGITHLYFYKLSAKSYEKVDLQWEWGLGRGYEPMGNHTIASLANGATNQLGFYFKNGSKWQKSAIDLGSMNEHTDILSISKDGKKVAFRYSTGAKLPAYYTADISMKKGKVSFENQREFVKLNGKLKKKPVAKHEVMRWKGYNGDEVTGLLYYPENYEEGKRYPLMLSIHGGPSGVDTDTWSERWSTYPQIISQRGSFVLKPNYHGSSNHGLEFVESIKRNYYDPELEDMMKAIDELDQKGMIDKNQMGAMGWSNGAILVTMMTVRYPDLFKVACPGAGDVNWTSDYGTCRFGVTFNQSYFGGAPWDNSNGQNFNTEYIRLSPLFEMEKVKTPTIIFHGSADRAVPRDQGWEYYRSLQQIGQAPVRFLWFPNQPHGLQKITHQLRKMNEELAWIDRYLFEKEEEKNEAFKKESPLASLLKLEKASMEDMQAGEMNNGVLVPEVVAIANDSIAIGRFEVTNAQWKAYKPNHSFLPLAGNHPVTGISYENAKAYAQWLSEKTGGAFRLPNAKEAKKMHDLARKKAGMENSLAYWAGYQLTMEDAEMLKAKLAEVKTTLLKPVGSFAPQKIGKAELYDIGGNAAEYFDDNGKAGVYGFSAYDYADPNSEEADTAAENIGFRVVRE